MKKKQTKSKKKIVFKLLLILVLILLVLFIFRYNIEATYKGIDVKYIENPRYCQIDSDCAQQATCRDVNIYNYKNEYGSCKRYYLGYTCENFGCEPIKPDYPRGENNE